MVGLPQFPHILQAEATVESPEPSIFIFTMDAREGRIGNSFACERCRKHKVRCVPSDIASICQRCQKARVECIEHVARRRPAKPRVDSHAPNKMRDLDKKLDKISAIVATMAPNSTQNSTPNSTPQSTLPSVAILPSQVPETAQRTPSPPHPTVPPTSAPSVQKPPVFPAPRPASISESSLMFWESINDTLSSLGRIDPILRSISVVHMQMLLDTYRTMVDYFPFVSLPNDCSCKDLIQHRPMLMFAVLTVASHDSVLLQLKLSREFRKVIMVKIMNGEKSLDLLQGLLVFIAWHHHYMDSQAVSIPMLIQICVGIACDLGLDNISNIARSPLQREDPRDREAKRAYLGCYYLVSNVGLMEPNKARCLSYSSTLRNYASELASIWEHKSDAVLPILIDVCQFMEDIEETFREQSGQALVTRSQVKRLNDKWEHIRQASKLQATDFETLQWIQLAARIHLYRAAASVDLTDRESTPWASGFQLSLRVTSLRSVEQYLDNSAKLSSTQFEYISIVDWLNMISAMTNLSKLALQSSPTPGWDPAELQIAKSFEYFRDQLASRMPRVRDPHENSEDVFERFRRVTAIMKTALRNSSGRCSPSGSTFELATCTGRTVSLLQDIPLPKPGASTNGIEKLPTLWKSPSFNINHTDFPWKFLMGTV
ncbi:hypothetical protein P153DRAFT_300614 [Dothidotthia symphoricarpi CBS 119687]|uniref:Zn(2)-C6 fungal-type domain-containing protein n=1 Tax=Dothidotthia symphoricarpi CBS 119687 TaxID=1392245 RepID=A0A6A6A1H6_9PLEO|nr:uncharacterized protein P153DRAFT_300614 [Dothidotthia symphoricarpi CBS 119687]KAF2125014.1 hypothetical protein P153DRAFT_300614 [Dothidotthia symphoricarpi CBS 119687]